MLLSLWPVILPLFDANKPENPSRQLYKDTIPTRLPYDDSLIRRNMEEESLLIMLLNN